MFVRRDLCRLSLPRLAVVAAAIDFQRCWGMASFGKSDHISGGLIYREAASLEPGIRNGDGFAERFATIRAATDQQLIIPERYQHGPIVGDRYVWVPLSLVNTLRVELGRSEKGSKIALLRGLGRRSFRDQGAYEGVAEKESQ